ncbi:MAG TPA: biotin synthase BioB [Syntrophales bacterium]|nr:biotin synthase BioB [Syntrophales bacterium]
MFNKTIIELTARVIEYGGDAVSYEDACELAKLPEKDTMDLLFCAHKIKKMRGKEKSILCSIINAKSGFCSEDCAFCAQSAHHRTEIKAYPLLDEDEIVKSAIELEKGGATRYSMVTSGYMLTDKELDVICRSATAIARETHLTVCASLGMLNEAIAMRLAKGGIAVYHHNLETARSFFDNVCTTHDYDEDIITVNLAKAAGMKACSGGILGLGETWEQRVELALTLKELDVDGIPINFLNPIPGTPMGDRPLLTPLEALKCIAIFRFVNPDKNILICGGREVTLRDYQSWAPFAGANGIMIGNYLTTQGRNIKMDIDMVRDHQGLL